MKNKPKTTKTEKPKQKEKKKQGFWLWNLLSSVKLAVIVIFLIAIGCILGTFIIQGRSTDEYIARYGKGWATFLESLEFTNVFYSNWFTILLLLLCANLAVCAIKRWRNTVLQVGFLSTHLSLILIMIGGIIDGKLGAKGAINLLEGQKVDYFFTFDDMKKVPLGFELMLEDFELVKHEPKYELISYVKKNDKEERMSTDVGKKQSVPSSDYKIEVKKFIPNAELVREPINTAKEIKNPAIFVQLFGSNHIDAEGWLIAKNRNWYEYKRKGLRFEYIWAKTAEELKEHTSSTTKSKPTKTSKANKGNDRIIVTLKDKDLRVELPFKLGEHYHVGNTDFHVQVLDYVPDFSNRHLPADQQKDVNPAVKVEIHGPQGNEERWIFANYPDWDEMHERKYGNLKLVYEFSGGSAQSLRHLVKIVQGPEEDNKLVYIKDGKLDKVIPWELDRKYSVGDSGYQIKLTKYFPSFGMREEVVQKSDELVNPAIFLEANGPSGKMSEWLFAKDARAWWYKDGNLAVLYQEEREMIKDFESTLKIFEDGKVVVTKTIEVNDPLSYKGIDFYQANYDPNNPKFSGIQITSHPGIPVVFAGFWILVFGVVFIFYIKPFIKRSRNKKRKEEAHA